MFVTHDMSSGGAERKINNIIWHLDRRRFDVHLVLHRMDIVFALPKEIATYELGIDRKIKIFKGIRTLRNLINEIQPDLLVTSALNPALLSAEAIRGMERRPKCIAMIASNPAYEPGWRQPWARRSYRVFDYFLTSCDRLGAIFLETYPFIDPERVLVWYKAIDVERVTCQAADETDNAGAMRASLVAIGRLCDAKRYDVLLDAFAKVRIKHRVSLLILGEGPLRRLLEERVQELGVRDSVYMPGFSANPYPALAAADLCLMSSDYEGTPNVLLEAQALGIPVVSTDCPTGPSDIIDDGRTGLLVPRGDSGMLADAICTLLEETELRKNMGEAAKKWVREHFDVPVSIPDLEAKLEMIAEVSPEICRIADRRQGSNC